MALAASSEWLLGGGLVATAIASLPFAMLASSAPRRGSVDRGRALPKQRAAAGARPIVLQIGKATGKLAKASHGAAIRRGEIIRLIGDEASQNIIVYGGVGSGKTTCVVNPLIAQCLDQDCGMLAFDVKGDWGRTLLALAAQLGRSVETIGIGGRPFNLLSGQTPDIAASYIKSALLLAGNTSAESTFWNEISVQLAFNVLTILSFLGPRYSLAGLYNYVFSATYRDEASKESDAEYARLTGVAENENAAPAVRASAEEARTILRRSADYEESVFFKFDEKVQSGVRAQLSQIVELFTRPAIERAFCTQTDDDVRLEEMLDGAVFLLDLPIQRYGLAAKTVYTFVKLRFFSVVEERRIHPEWNQTRALVFVCDEYQEVVSVAKDARSDLTFWDKARSAKCVGIISAQGVSSFRAAIGNHTLTDALLQNFRQQICFANEDEATIKQMTYLLGQVDIKRENRSRSLSSGRSSSSSRSTSLNLQQQSVINPQLFRRLGAREALAVLRIGGEAFDDILEMTPLYVTPTVEMSHAATV